MKKIALSVFFVFFFALCVSALSAAPKGESGNASTLSSGEGQSLGMSKGLNEPDPVKIDKVDFDGSLEVNALSLNNSLDFKNTTSAGVNDDRTARVLTRTFFGVTINKDEDISARVLLGRNNRQWGTSGTVSGESVNNDFGGGVIPSICVDNAFLAIDKVLDTNVKLTAGRQFYGEKGDLVIYYGPTDDNALTIGALDSVKGETEIADLFNAELMFGKVADTGVVGETDTNLYGVNLNSEKIVNDANLGAFYYNNTTQSPITKSINSLDVAGAKINGKISDTDFGYKAEAAFNFGSFRPVTTHNYTGNAIIVGANMDRPMDSMRGVANIEYARGSGSSSAGGNFASVNSDLRYGLIFGNGPIGGSVIPAGTPAVGGPGIGNLSVVNVGVGLKELTDKKLSVLVDYYNLALVKQTIAGDGTALGNEVDIQVLCPIVKSVNLGVSYAMLSVGSGLKKMAGGNHDMISRWGADMYLKF